MMKTKKGDTEMGEIPNPHGMSYIDELYKRLESYDVSCTKNEMECKDGMSGTYEIEPSMVWYDIESNKMHLKKDGEHYVADNMLFRKNLNLRQENESLKKENDRLRKERDHWHVEQVHASELEAENAKLKRKLEILKDYGIEIVDAVAGGFEIYNKEYARADRLQAENDKLDQKRIALIHKVDQLNEVIRRQRKQLTEVQETMRKRNADNKILKQVSEKLFRTVNHFCVKGYPCISCPLCREESPCELVKSYFSLKELGCDVRAWR